MDEYKASIDVKSMNSQVTEQANAGIQKLKGSLSYMNFDNFMFTVGLFFDLKSKKYSQ